MASFARRFQEPSDVGLSVFTLCFYLITQFGTPGSIGRCSKLLLSRRKYSHLQFYWKHFYRAYSIFTQVQLFEMTEEIKGNFLSGIIRLLWSGEEGNF